MLRAKKAGALFNIKLQNLSNQYQPTTYVLIENTSKCRWKKTYNCHPVLSEAQLQPPASIMKSARQKCHACYNLKPSWQRHHAPKSPSCHVIKINLIEKRTIFFVIFFYFSKDFIKTRSPRTHLPLPFSPSLLFFTGKRTKSLGPRSPSVSILNSKILYF